MRKTMMRLAAAGCCIAMTAGLMACSGQGSSQKTGVEGTTAAGSGGSGENVTLRYAIWGASQQEISQQLADAFHEKYPNITVEVEYTPQNTGEYWTKLESSCTGGSAPDVFWMNGVHADTYMEGGMMLPLT